MKESEYIAATDLARVRIIRSVVRDLSGVGSPSIPQDEYRVLAVTLSEWEGRLAEVVSDDMDANE